MLRSIQTNVNFGPDLDQSRYIIYTITIKTYVSVCLLCDKLPENENFFKILESDWTTNKNSWTGTGSIQSE